MARQTLSALTPEEMQEKLNKIAEGNRQRSVKYLERQRAKGKTPLTILLSEEAYQEVLRRKEAGMAAGETLTISDVINQALIVPTFKNVETTTKDIEGTTDTTPPDRISNLPAYKTWLFAQIEALKSQGNSYAQIADMLNQKGIVGVAGRELNKKTIEGFFNKLSKERLNNITIV
ncbi:MAG: hypothetical protein HQK72_17480 [Desulfamplus sp.]|nr:hypothetical protein [Desulfamplus sp.]